MKKSLQLLRNKFILATVIFLLFALFLDENDIFTIISQNNKLRSLESEKTELETELQKTRITLKKLEERSEVERYAREEKFFKKDDEDVFVIFYE